MATLDEITLQLWFVDDVKDLLKTSVVDEEMLKGRLYLVLKGTKSSDQLSELIEIEVNRQVPAIGFVVVLTVVPDNETVVVKEF